MDLQLKGSVVMVVGATGGIGSAVAEAFAAEGAQLALVGRDQAKLAQLQAGLERHDVDRAVFTCDLLDAAQPAEAVKQAEAHFGRLDVMAICSGNARRGTLDDVTDANFE